MKMRAVICGYYGQGNGGDEALLVSLLQMLPKGITPVVISHNPSKTHASYGVETCPSRSPFPLIKALRSADIFIWGGGSLMQDITSFASPIYYAGVMALAQKQGLRTIAWAQGIGPLKHSFTRWLTEQVLKGCTSVSVRDTASAQLVVQWGINPMIAPDPVWALESRTVPELSDLPAPRVAVNLRNHPQLTPERLEILTQALITFQKATNTYILLVPFQQSQDLAIANFIANRLQDSHKIMNLEDPRELKGLFRGVEMTIGMRYHSLIMAAAEGCRCFALSYDPKVSKLMREVDLPGWELRELPNDPNVISTMWINHYVNGESLSKDQIQSLVDRAFMHQEVLQTAIR